MSWTDNLEQARRFAAKPQYGGKGIVVLTVVEPSSVLARFVHGRCESEWVIDPCYLEVVEVDVVGLHGAPGRLNGLLESPLQNFGRDIVESIRH